MEDSTLQPASPAQFLRRLPQLLLLLLAAFAAGCSAQAGNLHLVSLDQKHEFSQKFTQAYITRNESGDADIVLIQDNIHPSDQDPSRPQHPDPCVMPRELVHIRVFWTPMSGVKPDHPANTNASIHWCFICDNMTQAGVVEYCGSGLVQVDDSSNGAKITIRKAWMKVGCQRGEMIDPLGPSILNGSFQAAHDDAQVKSIIAQIKSAATNTAEAQAANTVSPVN
jgi:hypothetical protein